MGSIFQHKTLIAYIYIYQKPYILRECKIILLISRVWFYGASRLAKRPSVPEVSPFCRKIRGTIFTFNGVQLYSRPSGPEF
jgi:hypothetical protein